MVGACSLPDSVCEVDGCEGSAPRHTLPRGPDTNERDHGAIDWPALARHQLESRVRNHDPPVAAQGRDLVGHAGVAQLATPHCPIEPVPVQPAKNGRDDDIEIATERLVRGITYDLGDLVSPLVDDAVAIHGYRGALVLARRPQSVHTLITGCSGGRFTTG